jgi:hypothetical protein
MIHSLFSSLRSTSAKFVSSLTLRSGTSSIGYPILHIGQALNLNLFILALFINWEATLEPIHLSPDGQFYVADEDVVIGPKGIRITKSKVLLG